MNRAYYLACAAAMMVAAFATSAAFAADASAEEQLQRVMAKLKQLNPKFDRKETHIIENGQVVELKFSSIAVSDLSPLRELGGLKRLFCLGDSNSRRLADLSPLRGLQLNELDCSFSQVKGLEPLAGMPLEKLVCRYTLVSDISPLKNVPLKWLNLNGTPINNIMALSNSQLKLLNIRETRVEDLSPLQNTPLESLAFDIKTDRDRQIIAGIKTLKRLNSQEVSKALGLPVPSTQSQSTQTVDKEAQKDAKAFARNQSSIKGLFIRVTSMGQHVGGAQDIIASVERTDSKKETICDIFADAAKDTKISMEEAERLLKMRYPVWQAGRKIRFSYGDKYAKQAGGSAGGAFSVLLLSLLDGFQIDPGFAMTGDVTVDGKIREIGAAAEKIRGAMLEKCSVVAIPAANKENLNDLASLYSPAMFWSIQILSVSTLDNAAAVARQDRDKYLANALTLFYQIQRGLGPNAPVAYLRNQDTYMALQQVVQLAPNHLSAEFMLRAANNRLPNTLSLPASIEEIWAASSLMRGYLLDDKAPDAKKNTRYVTTQLPAEAIKVALDRLTWLDTRLHPKTKDLKSAMYDYIQSLDNLRRQGGVSTTGYSHNLSKRDKVLGEFIKLGTDRGALEEMMH